MSTPEKQTIRARLTAARVAICALLGALEKVRELIAGGYFVQAREYAEDALREADAYLALVDGGETNDD